MINSRLKGKRGELDAASFMGSITGLEWERTAQRWGKAKADIHCPALPDLGLHVEVKLWHSGLTRMVNAARRFGLTENKDGIYVADASMLPIIAEGTTLPEWDREQPATHRLLRSFIDKAASDAMSGHVPLVLFREDRSQWCAAWRHEDDDGLIEVFKRIAKERPREV
jgi:hypothetical protein